MSPITVDIINSASGEKSLSEEIDEVYRQLDAVVLEVSGIIQECHRKTLPLQARENALWDELDRLKRLRGY